MSKNFLIGQLQHLSEESNYDMVTRVLLPSSNVKLFTLPLFLANIFSIRLEQAFSDAVVTASPNRPW